MVRLNVKEADEVLGDKFNVLDQGYIRLIDYMGSDSRILDIAREHYGQESISDSKLMERIVDRKNKDLLGMVELKFHFEMPISEAVTFVYEPRANVNEFSLRYSEARDVFDNLRNYRSILGTLIRTPELEEILSEDESFSRNSFSRYSNARSPDRDIAKEIARSMLGSNLYTRFYWKINLGDLLDFSTRSYREDPSQQTEDYVRTLVSIANKIAPLTVSQYLFSEGLSNLIEDISPNEKADTRFVHAVSPEAEKLIDIPLGVLGNSSITLVDYMGNDMSVLNAARVSTGKDEKPRSEAENRGLINYLMRHRHTTPSEMVEFLWKFRVPLFVYRQGGRHRTFERVLCDADDDIEFYHPEKELITAQSRSNHQGRGEAVHQELAQGILDDMNANEREAMALYNRLRIKSIDVSTSKRHLPVNRLLTYYFKGDLHNVLHYLGLRLESHAQYEIREASEAIAMGVKAVAPWTYDAFEKYKLNSMSFSSTEIEIVKAILTGQSPESAYPKNWGEKNRERLEFEEKLNKLRGN